VIVWVTREYGLSGLWVMRESTVTPNLIPLGDLSGPLKGAFSQEEINQGFFLNFV